MRHFTLTASSVATWYRIGFCLLLACSTIYIGIYTSIFLVDKSEDEFFRNITSPVVLSVDQMKRKIARLNFEQRIYNQKRFGPVKNDSLVIVVQVHNRLTYLQHLIYSLRLAYGIDRTLLVFSHDIFDWKINSVITAIRFCKVMQIFYPYSLQTHPNEFPGNDCPENESTENPTKKPCLSNLYVDTKGNHRDPMTTQIKHHWWWKAHKVFALRVLRGHTGLVLFLEKDMYLLEDFIFILNLMMRTREKFCHNCKALSLATNNDKMGERLFDSPAMTSVVMQGRFSNFGLAFNRSTWAEMIECRRFFCMRDEYNWDFSLLNVFTTCMQNSAAMVLLNPRVVHFGVCGMHFKSKNCDMSAQLFLLQNVLEANRNRLYPEKLRIVERFGLDECNTEFGGWSDPRDHALCLNISDQYNIENEK